MPQKVSTERPAQTTNAKERGQMLRHLISLTGKSVPVFAEEAGLNRGTMSAMLNGQNDPETARAKTAQRIALALGMTDQDIAEALGLSQEARIRWRTNRPAPVGSGTAVGPSNLEPYRLHRPMMGEVVLPVETVITVDTAITDFGVQVVKLGSGELFSMKAGAGAWAAGQVIGRLMYADFSAVLSGSALLSAPAPS